MKLASKIMGASLSALNRLAGLPLVDRLGLRRASERAVYQATKTGFRAAGAVGRSFAATQKLLKPARLPKSGGGDLFDLTPSDEQQMLQETVRGFALEQLRTAASKADHDANTTDELLRQSNELGVALMTLPEEFGGAGSERSAITQALVTEAMAQGDLGLAVSCLASNAVSTALVLWGDETQQATYLPAFAGETPPLAALAVMEPQPLFDALALKTVARRNADGWVLDGVKALVPHAARAELFIIAAEREGQGPALFIVESRSAGLTVEAEPAMGLRAAATGRVHLQQVQVNDGALLGGSEAREVYTECIQLSRLAWCAAATGTAQAVLDYLIPYVNERIAFGEPISHRQSVAFAVANVGIELEGMRLLTYRAASRAEQGKSFAQETALARRLCADKGMAIGSDGVQLLGGHGFVKEHPVERWYRDLRAAGLMEGVLLI